MEIGINKKEHKHKGQLGGGAANSSNLKRINLALQGGVLTALSQRHECRRGERYRAGLRTSSRRPRALGMRWRTFGAALPILLRSALYSQPLLTG